jgi:hypothetical protein
MWSAFARRVAPSPARSPWSWWNAGRLIAGLLLVGACSDTTGPAPAAAPLEPVAPQATLGPDSTEAAVRLDDATVAAAAVALTNGANQSGSITLAGETDSYTFTAAVGNSISLSVGEVTGSTTFTPWVRLVAPNGTVVGNNWGASVGQVNVNATAAGTYTVLIASGDAGRVGTGTYRLTLALAPGAFVVSAGDEGGALTNGANHEGTIVTGDLDMWRFTANQGDAIALSVGKLSGSATFTPWIRLVAPNGVVVGNNWGASAGQVNVNASVAGTYTVIIGTGDAARTGTGTYRLTLVKAPGAITTSLNDEGGPMTNGATHTGTITVGDLDAWTFAATQGDAIALSVGNVSGSATFTPWIRLVAPNGVVVGNNWGASAGQVNVNASVTGTYTVIIGSGDAARAGTGTYRLTLAKGPGALTISAGDEGGPMTNGPNFAGTIVTGDLDAWTFAATAGDAIALSVGKVTGSATFTPWIRLVAPNGVVVGNNWGASAGQVNVSATVTGTYTVIIGSGDAARAGTGTYRLTLAKAPGTFTISAGDEGGAMTNGSNYDGTIVVGDLDMWRFTANQGDAIALSVGKVTGSATFTPWIRLVAPNGVVVGNNWGASAGQVNVTATVTGTYTVIIGSGDAARAGTGTYRLTLAKAPGAFTISAGDEGGALPVGPVQGTITVGDLDMWSFTRTQGSTIVVNATELTGSATFTPWIRLVAPNGVVIGNNWGAASAQITVVAPSTGTYTVIVGSGDAARDGTGTYRLTH